MVFILILRKPISRAIIASLCLVSGKLTRNLEESSLKALEFPLRLLLVILGSLLSVEILSLPESINTFVIHIIRSLILFSIFWILYKSIDAFFHYLEKKQNRSKAGIDFMLQMFFRKGLKTFAVILGILMIIQEWEYNITGLLTGLGLGGLAFALAAKDTLSNLFGSIMIMADRPFVIGDWIMTPHVEGIAEEIGFRSTKVRTFSQALVSIPNSIMSNEPITNWSRMQKRKLSFRLGLTYATTEKQLQECLTSLRQMLEEHPDIHKDVIMVYFEKFGENALEIFLYFYTCTTNWQQFFAVQEDVNLKIMHILEELKLCVAFPTRSIHIEK